MKIYVASSIKNKDSVRTLFQVLEENGHEVTTDWTLTDDISENERGSKGDYIGAIAKRDFEGIRECSIFVLLSEPSEARSMYVELGVALAYFETTGSPDVFVMGAKNDQSVFHFHPAVARVSDVEELLRFLAQTKAREIPSRANEGRLEEYKALRAEMLEIIKDRVWGQATYAVTAGGLLSLLGGSHKVAALVFLIGLAIPFLVHTMIREHARIRMGNYLRGVLEPAIPGMYWESYLALWRGRFGKQEGQGWLNAFDRAKHIVAHAGLYAFMSASSLWLLFQATQSLLPLTIGTVFMICLLAIYAAFYRLYSRGAEEYRELRRLRPRG